MLFDNGLTELISLLKNMDDCDKKKLKEILEKINTLDSNHKAMILELMLEDFEKNFKKTIKHQNDLMCNQKGHEFSRWIHREWSEVGNAGDFVWKEDPFVNKECWERTCLRCGFIETVDKEPELNENVGSNVDKIARMKQLRKDRKNN